MRKSFQMLSLTALAAATVGSAHAVSVPSSVSTVAGSDYSTAALSGFSTTGAMMDGMIVEVLFADTTSSSAVWGATGGSSGKASGTGWSLSLSGDSFGSAWGLANTGSASSIVGFSINAAPGSTSFDVVNGDFLTPGSANGLPFGTVNLTGAGTVTSAKATYSNRLFVGGSFHGDQYEFLSVSLVGGIDVGGTLSFYADTDNAQVRGTIVPGIPEPETYALFLMGLGLVGYVARRRRG